MDRELIFCKLGGSLITDKRREATPRSGVITRLAAEIASATAERPGMRLLLGHGSGSFGHFAAEAHGVHLGNLADWRGYAETGAAAQRLNRLVVDALLRAGVRAVSVQPSASAQCQAGRLVEMATEPIATLLAEGAVPVVFGDVAVDAAQGCTILSTEQVLAYLARAFQPERMIIAGEVAGVYSGDPLRDTVVRLIPEITPANYDSVRTMLRAAFGVDVTGGMLSKVEQLYHLVRRQPGVKVRIITGARVDVLRRALVNPTISDGTVIRAA